MQQGLLHSGFLPREEGLLWAKATLSTKADAIGWVLSVLCCDL